MAKAKYIVLRATPRTAPSENVIDAVFDTIEEVLLEYLPKSELWRFHVPVNYHVREVLSEKTAPEQRTGTAITGRVCYITATLTGMNPLPDECVNKLREKIDALLGGGQPLKPLD